jgi:subtilisin family serine protease
MTSFGAIPLSRLFVVTFVVALTSLASLDPATATQQDSSHAPLIVGFDSASHVPAVGSNYHGGTVLKNRLDLAYALVSVDESNAKSVEASARTDPHVKYTEWDLKLMRADFIPNDPDYVTDQYDLRPQATDAQTAWDKTLGSASVKVCIPDSGVWAGHPDFAHTAFYYWKDEVNGIASAYDDFGHGTHVTGTLAAGINDNTGVAGIAQVSVGNIKVLDSSGSGTFTQVANGVADCQASGADIISMSLGCNGGIGSACDSSTLHTAITNAYNAGILIVAAAGNAGPCTNCVGLPAAYSEALAVSCSDETNNFCSFSSQGPQVFVMAPGNDIMSTVPTGTCALCAPSGYLSLSGTSMATPHVAGEAALLKTLNPGWTNAQLKSRIGSTAVPQGSLTANQEGNGLINMANAVGATNQPFEGHVWIIDTLGAVPPNPTIVTSSSLSCSPAVGPNPPGQTWTTSCAPTGGSSIVCSNLAVDGYGTDTSTPPMGTMEVQSQCRNGTLADTGQFPLNDADVAASATTRGFIPTLTCSVTIRNTTAGHYWAHCYVTGTLDP